MLVACTVGFSIQSRAGSSIARIYPSSSRRPIEIVTKDVGQDDSFLRGIIQAPEQRQRLDRRETVLLRPADAPIEALCQVIATLAGPPGQ